MAGPDPLKEALLKKLRAQIKTLEDDLASLEAKTAGAAKAEVMMLRSKKDEFDAGLDEVERAGDEAWETLMEGLRLKAIELKESLERVFSKRRP